MPADSPFSNANLANAVKALPDLPPEQVNLGVAAKNGEVGVEVEANKTLGKGFFVEGDASWWKQAGYSVAAWIGWKAQGRE